jgi:hypothetical protein
MKIYGPFQKGTRVKVHPATDLFMQGAVYGNVEKIGRKYLHVRFDRLPNRAIKVVPSLLEVVRDA